MNKKMTCSIATLIACTASGAAFAGSYEPAPESAPVMAPAPIPVAAALPDWTGGYLGLQAGYGSGEADDVDADGFLGGAQAGYRQDLGRWVVGGEFDYNFANLETDDGAGEIDEIARLKLQTGYKFGRALVYGTAGLAYASANVGGEDLSDNGWAAGLGMDYLVTDNVTAGVEYLYHDFSDFDDSGADVNLNTISAKVSYKF